MLEQSFFKGHIYFYFYKGDVYFYFYKGEGNFYIYFHFYVGDVGHLFLTSGHQRSVQAEGLCPPLGLRRPHGPGDNSTMGPFK